MRTQHLRLRWPAAWLWRAAFAVAVMLPATSFAQYRVSDLIEWDRLQVSGYGNAHVMDHDGAPRTHGSRDLNEPLYQVRELSLFLDFTIGPGLTASAEVGFAKNFDHLNLNYAYLDVEIAALAGWETGVNLRLGRFLVPFLSYNENKPNFKQHLMSQPFTAWQIAPVISSPTDFDSFGWSDEGLSLGWNQEAGEAGILSVQLALMQGLQSRLGAFDGNAVTLEALMPMGPAGMLIRPTVRPRDGAVQNETAGGFDDNNDNLAVVVKAAYLFNAIPLELGSSWYKGAWDDAGNHDLEMYGAYLNWRRPRWTVKGEWAQSDVEQMPGINVVSAPGPPPINRTTADYTMAAWYIEGSVKAHVYGDGGAQFVRLVLRYDDVDTNDQAMFTPWDRRRWTTGAEWQLHSNGRLRYEWQRSTLRDFARAPMPFVAAGGRGHIEMHMASVIFWF